MEQNLNESDSLSIKPGMFDSTEIHVKQTAVSLTDDDKTFLDLIEKTKTKGALWIFLHKSQQSKFFDHFTTRIYDFHHYEKDHFVLGKWNNSQIENKMQPYATSIGGAAVMILSPDMREALMVFEYGKFKFVTGAQDLGESKLDTALREMTEETGLIMDETFAPIFCGGYDIGNAKPTTGVNDSLICYAIRVRSKDDLKLDVTEITEAKWFSLDDLNQAYNAMNQSNSMQNSKAPHRESFTYNSIKFGCPYLFWVNNFDKLNSTNIFHTQKFNNMIIF